MLAVIIPIIVVKVAVGAIVVAVVVAVLVPVVVPLRIVRAAAAVRIGVVMVVLGAIPAVPSPECFQYLP